MVVSDIDIRLLRVFRAVVESGGFTNAQVILNIGTSTISAQMSQLETRLGYVLCHRGRSGFKLTDKGEALYRLVIDFFQSVQNFESLAGELRGDMTGQLRVGFIDNVINDPKSPILAGIESFRRHPRNQSRLLLEVLSPQELEQGLLEHKIDVAIAIFYSRRPELHYEQFYIQRDILVCHRNHPLAQLPDDEALMTSLKSSSKVLRSFIGTHEFSFAGPSGDTLISSVSHIEAAALMILTGGFIGFLPKHYAQPWLDSGELVELLPDQLYRDTQFCIVTRSEQVRPPPALHTLLGCLRTAKVQLCDTKEPIQTTTSIKL